MKTKIGILASGFAFTVAIAGAFASVTAAPKTLVNQGYASPQCAVLRNITNTTKDCAINRTAICTINNQTAYATPEACAAADLSQVLKFVP